MDVGSDTRHWLTPHGGWSPSTGEALRICADAVVMRPGSWSGSPGVCLSREPRSPPPDPPHRPIRATVARLAAALLPACPAAHWTRRVGPLPRAGGNPGRRRSLLLDQRAVNPSLDGLRVSSIRHRIEACYGSSVNRIGVSAACPNRRGSASSVRRVSAGGGTRFAPLFEAYPTPTIIGRIPVSTRTHLSPMVLEEAADWFVKFRMGRVSASDREAFVRWIRQSPKHVQAYLEEVLAHFDGASVKTCDRLANRVEERCSNTPPRRLRGNRRR